MFILKNIALHAFLNDSKSYKPAPTLQMGCKPVVPVNLNFPLDWFGILFFFANAGVHHHKLFMSSFSVGPTFFVSLQHTCR